jgi:hypothetical protein
MAVPPKRIKGCYGFSTLSVCHLLHHPIALGPAGYAVDSYPFHSIHDALHYVFDAFGPRRMFWGTDITRMHCTWRQCVTLFTEELPWLHGADLDLVMGEAFCYWIGWQTPGS